MSDVNSKKAIKVLFVSTEVSPYSKTGGLGDVAGSMPIALRRLGVDVRVVMPKFSTISADYIGGPVANFTVHMAWRAQNAVIFDAASSGGAAVSALTNKDSVYFIENDYFFDRDNLYGYDDDHERFAFFTKAAIEMLGHINFKPDILHFNDWHTGLGPTFLRDVYNGFTFYKSMKSLFTIHNLHYQGVFGKEVLWDIGLNDGYFTNGDLEFHGNISYMKAGIVHANAVSTVSRTYANEITTPAYGYGMDGLLKQRGQEGRLFGIVNGIDTALHDPQTDTRIFDNLYIESNAFAADANNSAKADAKDGAGAKDCADTKDGADTIVQANDAAGMELSRFKRKNKYHLQEQLGLPITDVPMISMITRLAEQKGLDIVAFVMEELMGLDIQLVILGTGEGRYEDLFRDYAHRYPHKISANITFDITLAQRIYAGSDMFLMPSVYEPCGLGQIFAMRYGTIPIVRKTGGLADTVSHFDRETLQGNGFLFEDCVASGLMWAVNEGLGVYNSNYWGAVVKNALNCDFSWDSSAKEYVRLYEMLRDDRL